MTTKDALKAIGADSLWADKAQWMLLAILGRLEVERDERKAAGLSMVFPCAAMIDDIEKITRSRPLQQPTKGGRP